MIISFDLDDTLIIPSETGFPTEQRNFLQKLLGVERLRHSTSELLRHLKEKGHKVGIYTTSYRPKLKLRLHLLTYGINPDFIITEKENRRELFKRQINCSKYPPAFNIDLYIDDSPGVEREGQIYNFQTIIIYTNHIDWLYKITNKCYLHLTVAMQQHNLIRYYYLLCCCFILITSILQKDKE